MRLRAVAAGARKPVTACPVPHRAAAGFYIFYNSIFAMFCPLWVGETELGGLRMVRAARAGVRARLR